MIEDPVSSSMRVTAAFLEVQVSELVRAGLGDHALVAQMRGCVERLRGWEPGPGECGTEPRPSLRLVGVEA